MLRAFHVPRRNTVGFQERLEGTVDPPLPHARTHARRHTVLTRVSHVSRPHVLVLVRVVPCKFVVC